MGLSNGYSASANALAASHSVRPLFDSEAIAAEFPPQQTDISSIRSVHLTANMLGLAVALLVLISMSGAILLICVPYLLGIIRILFLATHRNTCRKLDNRHLL